MGAAGRANTAQGIEAAGSLISLYSQNKRSKIAEGESRRQASLLNLTGDEIMRRFDVNKKVLEGEKRQAVGRGIASIGASGGGMDNNQVIMDMMNEADQAISSMQQEYEYNAWIQREEAAAYERQAKNEAKARKKNTYGTILGVAGTAAGAYFGGPAGASAGGAAGYAAGSALG